MIGIVLFLCCIAVVAVILYKRKTQPTQNNRQNGLPPAAVIIPDQNRVPLKQASTVTNAGTELPPIGPQVNRPDPINFDDPKQENRLRPNQGPSLRAADPQNKPLTRQDTDGEL